MTPLLAPGKRGKLSPTRRIALALFLAAAALFLMYLPGASDEYSNRCYSPFPAAVQEGKGLGNSQKVSLWPSGVRCSYEFVGGELKRFHGPGLAWNIPVLIAAGLAIGFVLFPLLSRPPPTAKS